MNDQALIKYMAELIATHIKDSEEQEAGDKGEGDKGKGKMHKTTTFGTFRKSFHDDEQMIATDVVYAPYELDAHGEWMDEETILKACQDFNDQWDKGEVSMNLFHLKNTDKVKLLKSYVLDEDTTYGDQLIRKGTWIAEYQFLDENLWKLKKAHVIDGLSLCGGCHRIEPITEAE